jgi:hypothetical protein
MSPPPGDGTILGPDGRPIRSARPRGGAGAGVSGGGGSGAGAPGSGAGGADAGTPGSGGEDADAEGHAQHGHLRHEHEHEHGHEHDVPAPSLTVHVFHLASQVAMALGEAENPLTGQRETDLRAARFLIDVVAMLEEKTRGNRTPEEDEYLGSVLTNLRMAYVKKSG